MFISTRQAEYYRWAEQTFEERNPNIDVIVEQFPGTSLKDFEIKLRLRYSSGKPPDIFQGHQNVTADFARLGLLAEAPDYIERMVRENSLNDMIRDAPYVDGVCYGITNDAVWQALFYNKQMFREAGLDPERPPTTWDELVEMADRLTIRRPDGTVARSGFWLRKTGFKPGIAEKWFTFLHSAGGQPFNEAGTQVTFNSEAGRRALGLYASILFEKNIDSAIIEGDQQGFGQRRVAMLLREMFVIRWMEERYPDVEFGVAPIPKDSASISSGGSYVFVVSKDSPHQEAAWRFVEFLMQDEAYSRYASIGGLLPITRSVAALPRYREDLQLNVFLEQEVVAYESFPRIAKATEMLGAYLERFMYGHLTAREMLDRAEHDINGILSRNRRRDAETARAQPADQGRME